MAASSHQSHTMNMSKFFIDRPIFAGVISILFVLAGLVAVNALPISEYPEVVPPQVVVRATYPGASPKVIAESVAMPLEESINGVEGMIYMGSQSTTDGTMTLTVTFRLGTDPDKAQQLVAGLEQLAREWPQLMYNIRGWGLYQGFSLHRVEDKGRLIQMALDEEDLLLLGAGTQSIRFRPPLDVSAADIELLLEKLRRLLVRLA